MVIKLYICRIFGLLGGLALITACSEPPIQKFEGHAQGTTYHISYWSKLPIDAQVIEKSIKGLI